MKKTILVLTALFLVFACDEEKVQAPLPSKTELLSGDNQKSWYIYSSTPEGQCTSGADDSWTFSADGGFAYDHGTVTEGEDEDGECGDLINLEGTWAFSEEETEITIIALRGTESTEDLDPMTIVTGDITTLTRDRFVITAEGLGSAEFRTR